MKREVLQHFRPMALLVALWRSQRAALLAGVLAVCVALTSCASPAASDNGSEDAAPDEAPAVEIDEEFEAKVLQVIRNNPQAILESVRAYEQEQQSAARAKMEESRQSFWQENDPKDLIGDSPTKGAEDGEVVLIEFSDFECPFCARALEALNPFMEQYGDRVTLVYKHFPLTRIHEEALPAALASWAAQQQGKFWEYHDALFAAQDRLGEELYVEIAEDLELDMEQFDRDRNSDEAKAAVEADMELAQQLQVGGTPTFFLNEEQVDLAQPTAFEKAFEEATK